MEPETARGGEFFLGIGEIAFAASPCLIRTVLGSCIGISLHDHALKIGGMCHYLLARAPKGQLSGRYGDVAIDALIKRFLKAGSSPGALAACVAGGSLLLDQDQIFFVGEQNVAIADESLERWGVTVQRREVGGNRGRRMTLQSDTGEVGIAFIPDFERKKNFIA